jgi:hypothetical protein
VKSLYIIIWTGLVVKKLDNQHLKVCRWAMPCCLA